MTIRLSICIPVYNFARFIPETLRSILSQHGAADVEIIVVDGASTDDTASVMRPFVEAHTNLHYLRLPVKGGIDRDMAKAVEPAIGDYVWLFSGDDLMLPGALDKARARIASGCDVYLCKHMEQRANDETSLEWPVMIEDREATYDMADVAQRHAYFANAYNTEAFFSFMGNIIVKRETWNSVPLDERFIGSCFAHSARLLSLMPKGLTLEYIPEAWLYRRPDNDSFMGAGLVQRFRIQIEGFHRMGDVLFGHDSVEAFHMRRAVRTEFPVWQLLYGKFMTVLKPEIEDRALMDRLARDVYQDFSLANLRARWEYRMTRMKTFRKWSPELVAKREAEWETERKRDVV